MSESKSFKFVLINAHDAHDKIQGSVKILKFRS